MSEHPESPARWIVPSLQDAAGAVGPLTADKIEAIRREAHAQAYAKGLEEGRRAGREELEKRLAEIDAVFADLSQPLRDLDEDVEKALVGLAVRVARQIIGRLRS